MNENVVYHVYNRGINYAPIFFEEKNYHYFLSKYDKYISPIADTLSYCLLPNHFHLLLRIKELRLPIAETGCLTHIQKAFKDFFISYAKSVNKHYGRSGALLQYKFKRKPVVKFDQIKRAIAYIHLNPVRSSLCSYPEDWAFSSFNMIAGKVNSRVSFEEILALYNDYGTFVKFHREYCGHEIDAEYLF